MGKFDLNMLRVDGNIFESGEKKFLIKKYPNTCGRGLNPLHFASCFKTDNTILLIY